VSASSGTTTVSAQLDKKLGIWDGPLVDSTAQRVYVFVGNDGQTFVCTNSIFGSSAAGCSGVFQFSTNNNLGSDAEAVLSTSTQSGWNPILAGTFDNIYFSSATPSSPTGHLYSIGTTGKGVAQSLWQIPISSNAMGTPANCLTVGNNNTVENFTSPVASPITEFFNGSNDYIFLGVPSSSTSGCSSGCVAGYNVASGSCPTSATGILAASSGPGGIIVDNSVGSGTLAGASEIYYTTLSSGSCASGDLCGVQATQSAP
jgi:hypothetical protein